MKIDLIITVTAVATAMSTIALLNCNSEAEAIPATIKEAFGKWVQKNGKFYESPNEYNYRLSIFYKKALEVEELRGKVSYQVKIGKFADLTKNEFLTKFTGLKFVKENRKIDYTPNKEKNPSTIDWRKKNIVNPIKDQKECGSCWAFSAIQTIESAWAQAGNTLTQFSEQQLVDCSKPQGNLGCDGGLMDWAFEYFQTAGTMTEAQYPYKAVEQRCQSAQRDFIAKVTQIHDIPANNGQALEDAAAGQVISVGVDANNFDSYAGGVFTSDSCGVNLNHGVGVVGYVDDPDLGKKYWIVRNSWGTSWADLGGYIWLEKDVSKSGPGTCGLRMKASYASVAAY